MVKVVRDKKKESMGYGYVNFSAPEDVQKARRKFNGHALKGKHLRVMPYNRDLSRYQANCNVYVRNIGDATVRELEALFSTCGNIISSKVMYDAEENSLGYGYILFATEEAAIRAIETRRGFNYMGNSLEVERFRPRTDRSEEDADFKGIYVKSVISEEEVATFFGEYGDIENVYTGDKFTIVSFAESAAAKAALEAYLDHPTLTVSRALTKTQLRTQAADRYS